MKKASISETKNRLSALIDGVRQGEVVLITDRGRAVARLEPVSPRDLRTPDRLTRLEDAGVLRRGLERSPKNLLRSRPPATCGGASVLEALLAERAEGR